MGNKACPDVSSVQFWTAVLTVMPELIAVALWQQINPVIAIKYLLIVIELIWTMHSSL